MHDLGTYLSILSIIATAVIGFWVRAFKTGQWASSQEQGQVIIKGDLAKLAEQIREILTVAAAQELRFREIFMSKELADERDSRATEEREHVRKQLAYVVERIEELAGAMHKDLTDLRVSMIPERRERDRSR